MPRRSAVFEVATDHPEYRLHTTEDGKPQPHSPGFHIVADGVCYGPFCKVLLEPLTLPAAMAGSAGAAAQLGQPAAPSGAGAMDDNMLSAFGAMGGKLSVMSYFPVTL